MADEERDKKKSPIMLIGVLVVVGLILAGGISYFIATKVMADTASKSVVHEPGIFVKLGDPKDGVIVNVGGVKSGRFLKIGVVLELNPGQKEHFKEGKILPNIEAKVLDSVLQILRSQKVEDFEPSKQDALKTLLKDEVNKTIGEGSVYEVFITNFVLQ